MASNGSAIDVTAESGGSDDPRSDYPKIAQSVGIAGILILASVVFSPLILLQAFIGVEAAALVYYLFTMVVTFWIAYAIRRRKTHNASFNLTIHHARSHARIIPFLVVASVAMLFGIVEPLGSLIPMPDFLAEAFLAMASLNGVFAFAMMVIAAPVFEELLFRGIILEGLLNNYSPFKAILVSSLLFGLVHLNPWQFIAGLVLGLFMGWVYYHTRSVLSTIIIHASANGAGYLARVFVDLESMMNNTSRELYGGAMNYGLLIAGSLFLVLICIYFLRREFRTTELRVA